MSYKETLKRLKRDVEAKKIDPEEWITSMKGEMTMEQLKMKLLWDKESQKSLLEDLVDYAMKKYDIDHFSTKQFAPRKWQLLSYKPGEISQTADDDPDLAWNFVFEAQDEEEDKDKS